MRVMEDIITKTKTKNPASPDVRDHLLLHAVDFHGYTPDRGSRS
jgi:hypothetical protein